MGLEHLAVLSMLNLRTQARGIQWRLACEMILMQTATSAHSPCNKSSIINCLGSFD
jgi:hypothetical protein